MESRNPEALLTTLKEMDSVSDSTVHSMTCCVPSHLRESESGLSTSRNCVMHITQLHIPLPGIPHTTSCLVLILNCQLISYSRMSMTTKQATMVTGLPYTRIVYEKLICKHRASFELKLSSARNSLIDTDKSSLMKFPLVREFSLAAIPKGGLRYTTDGTLRFLFQIILLSLLFMI